MEIDEILKEFMEWMSQEEYAPTTVLNYVCTVRTLLRKGFDPKMTPNELERELKQLGYSFRTILEYKRAWRLFRIFLETKNIKL